MNRRDKTKIEFKPGAKPTAGKSEEEEWAVAHVTAVSLISTAVIPRRSPISTCAISISTRSRARRCGDVTITDRILRMGFLKRRAELQRGRSDRLGLHHVGVEVDESRGDQGAIPRPPSRTGQRSKGRGGRISASRASTIPRATRSASAAEGASACAAARGTRSHRLRHLSPSTRCGRRACSISMPICSACASSRPVSSAGSRAGSTGSAATAGPISPFTPSTTSRKGFGALRTTDHVGFLAVAGMGWRNQGSFGARGRGGKHVWPPYAVYRLRDPEGNGCYSFRGRRAGRSMSTNGNARLRKGARAWGGRAMIKTDDTALLAPPVATGAGAGGFLQGQDRVSDERLRAGRRERSLDARDRQAHAEISAQPPTIVVQSVPGAGTLLLANQLYNTALLRTATFGLIAAASLEPLFHGPGVQFDPVKFNWIGSPDKDVQVCVAQGCAVRSGGSARSWSGATGVGRRHTVDAGVPIAPDRHEIQDRLGLSPAPARSTRGQGARVAGHLRCLPRCSARRCSANRKLSILFQASLKSDPNLTDCRSAAAWRARPPTGPRSSCSSVAPRSAALT